MVVFLSGGSPPGGASWNDCAPGRGNYLQNGGRKFFGAGMVWDKRLRGRSGFGDGVLRFVVSPVSKYERPGAPSILAWKDPQDRGHPPLGRYGPWTVHNRRATVSIERKGWCHARLNWAESRLIVDSQLKIGANHEVAEVEVVDGRFGTFRSLALCFGRTAGRVPTSDPE